MMRKWREVWGDDATYRNLIGCFLNANKPAWAASIRDMFRDANAPPPSNVSSKWNKKYKHLIDDLHIMYLLF